MKKLSLILLALVAISTTSVMAQETEAPKTGAKIYIENKSLEVQPNGDQSFDVYIVRSKRAGKTTFDMPKFSGSDGVTFDLAQDVSNPDHFVVTARGAATAAGKLFYTVTSKSNSGTQQISGTTLSVNVTNTKNIAASDNN